MIESHVTLRGHEAVTPTVGMLRYWWSKLNAELFDGTLLRCQLAVESCAEHEAVGLCWPLDGGRVRISIDPAETTRAGLLGTLAHEMVHQHQHQHGWPMDHGQSFEHWRVPILGLTGLHI